MKITTLAKMQTKNTIFSLIKITDKGDVYQVKTDKNVLIWTYTAYEYDDDGINIKKLILPPYGINEFKYKEALTTILRFIGVA